MTTWDDEYVRGIAGIARRGGDKCSASDRNIRRAVFDVDTIHDIVGDRIVSDSTVLDICQSDRPPCWRTIGGIIAKCRVAHGDILHDRIRGVELQVGGAVIFEEAAIDRNISECRRVSRGVEQPEVAASHRHTY